jgi:hypothetical protein
MLAEVKIEDNDDASEIRLTNVYEKLVFDHLRSVASELSVEAQVDVACIALNHLPRNTFAIPSIGGSLSTPRNLNASIDAVDMAVTNAIARVLDNPPLLETN